MNYADRNSRAFTFLTVCIIALIAAICWNTFQLKAIINDRWTGSDMTRWTDEFRQSNPGVKVPPAKHQE